jgi:Fe-S cluster biogenesis protein NfuA
MTPAPDPHGFRERMERLETLIEEAEQFPDADARAHTQEIVRAVLDLHGTGLQRILEHLTEAGEAGQAIANGLAQDDVVSGLLLLYDLHPLGVEARVRQALDRVRLTLRKHGGDVELLNLVGALVRVKVQVNGHGCGSTLATLRRTVEDAIYEKAPEVTTVEVEGLPDPSAGPAPTFVPLEQLALSLPAKHAKENCHGKPDGRNPAAAGACAGHIQR